MFKVKLPFVIIEDDNYDWQDALQLIFNKRKSQFIDRGRILRSYHDYWTGGIIVNRQANTIPILIEGLFSELRLNGQSTEFCGYKACHDPSGYLNHAKMHVGFLEVPPGRHTLIAKISDYHIKGDMAPRLSDIRSYEASIYGNEAWYIYITVFLAAIFFLLSMLSIAIYTKIKDRSFLFYALFCVIIGVHVMRSLGENYEAYDVIDYYFPWYYLKYFWFALLYYFYFKFGTSFINAETKYTAFYRLVTNAIRVLVVLVVPELILMYLGCDRLSYSYYFVVRYGFTLFGLYLMGRLWEYRRDQFVKFICIGGSLLLISEWITSTFEDPFVKLVGALGLMSEIIVFTTGLSYKIYYEYYHTILLENENFHKELTIQKLQEDKILLNMRSLQAQLNPHFIFNALNAIKEFVLDNKSTEASKYLSKFAHLMRKVLDYSYKESIHLHEEIEITKQFMEFHLLMSDYDIRYEINVNDDLEIELIHVPPLFMQPYIENIFKHAFPQRDGYVKIDIYEVEDQIGIDIVDNGVGRSAAKLVGAMYESKGMDINKERIKSWGLIYDKTCEVTIFDLFENKKGSGTKIFIRI